MKSSNSIFCFSLLLLMALNLFVDLQARQITDSDTLQTYVEEGKDLFTGKARLTEGGPACISCHTINDPELPVSGGTLAVNVTSFGNLPNDALQERIIDASFPHMTIMNSAYTNHRVTEQESDKIIVYLKHIAEQQQSEPELLLSGLNFLWTGTVVFLLFLAIIWLSWYSRKKGSVNKEIYQRQIQSV